MNDFWSANALAQIVTALILIVILLMYITYRIDKKSRR